MKNYRIGLRRCKCLSSLCLSLVLQLSLCLLTKLLKGLYVSFTKLTISFLEMIDHEFEFLIIYKHDKLRKNYGHDFKIKILVHDPTKAMTIFCQN